MTRLLIVDDSALVRRLLGDLFTAAGDFEVAFARDGLEALALLRGFNPDVITLDVHMPQMDGLTCLDQIMVEQPRPVVMVSSFTEAGAEVTLEAMALGAVDFIQKPEGAISLKMDQLGPGLVDKVRQAAGARLRRSHRLAERLRRQADAIEAGRPDIGAVPGGAVARAKRARLLTDALPQEVEGAASPAESQAVPGLVLIGCSTGGPPALDAVLEGLPADFPWPVLVAQHMPATFTGPLARRLDRLCALTVQEVARPTPLAPGNVYIGRGDADLVLSQRPSGLVALPTPAKEEYRWHPSVDRLVESALSLVEPWRLVGVLMTGMGYDGAAAMTRLRNDGGRTIAESEESAVVWGMPGELVKAGGADVVAPLEEISGRLVRMVAGR
ncbi:chemotaxis-specific protein-glutamate methyltransferase CheB [Nitrospirillum viridazoti]|uniref:Protein-glutamate methylesterase/protein-glutamine glutaminase n=1 Tax=Nitrospirillum viridazoti CBAmc TaxID=1441467 RepID=A0A248JX33_9PROT|nr:chemotaxis-specific protein-glutamate methyltransferase CheB [Nitrospirillum amazonense]ASG22754.1 chemotaxis response regulator protein-glutamate methylesterase [Nitrospirillum amazonense CBAmc]TWB33794.1 two-component system chemotaxis response regulator CheB [Nitrospirillum amazonense]